MSQRNYASHFGQSLVVVWLLSQFFLYQAAFGQASLAINFLDQNSGGNVSARIEFIKPQGSRFVRVVDCNSANNHWSKASPSLHRLRGSTNSSYEEAPSSVKSKQGFPLRKPRRIRLMWWFLIKPLCDITDGIRAICDRR